mgnify:CR=1 FL=1
MNTFKKLTAFAALTAAVATSWYFIREEHPASIMSDVEEKTPGQHPGWDAQWRQMKGIAEGEEMPFGLQQEWYEADQSKAHKKANGSGLLNIKEIGPSNIGGRTRDMLIDYSDDNRILACGNSGGVWESKDNARTWAPINDYASSLSTSSITQNPFDHDVFYYSTGEPSGNSSGVKGGGIFKSSDGGNSFDVLPGSIIPEFEYIWEVEHSLVDSHTIYVATPNRGLWVSENAGDSFFQVHPFGGDIHDIEVMADSSVFIALESRGVYYSPNGKANTFVLLDKGMPTSGFNRLDIAYCENFPNVIYALFAKGINGYDGNAVGVWKSSNKGKTWKLVGNPQTGTNESFGFPWYTLALGVDPNDTNKIVAGSAGFAYSINGGTTWSSGRDGHADQHCFLFKPNKVDEFYLGCDGGIYEYRWSSVGSSFSDRNKGYNVTQFYAGSYSPDSLGAIGGTQDNWTIYGQNGRSNFKQILGGDGAFCHVSQQQPNIAYVSSQNGNLRKTGALNNSVVSTIRILNEMDANFDGRPDDGYWFINPFEMNYNNGHFLYFPTKRRLWFSYDGGGSWDPMTNFKSNLYAVGVPNQKEPNLAYVGGDNLALWRINDVFDQTPGEEVSLRKNLPKGLNSGFIACITVHPQDESVLFVSLSNINPSSRVYRIDSADTDEPIWTSIGGDLPSKLPVNWIEIDPNRPDSFFIAATDFGLYTTSDAGQTWVKDQDIPNVSIHNIRLRHSDRKLFIYTHGRGIFAANLKKVAPPVSSINSTETPSINVYPNPSNDQLNIDLVGEFRYEILDIQGRNIKSGTATNQLNVSSLQNGNYFLRLHHGTQTYLSRFQKN